MRCGHGGRDSCRIAAARGRPRGHPRGTSTSICAGRRDLATIARAVETERHCCRFLRNSTCGRPFTNSPRKDLVSPSPPAASRGHSQLLLPFSRGGNGRSGEMGHNGLRSLRYLQIMGRQFRSRVLSCFLLTWLTYRGRSRPYDDRPSSACGDLNGERARRTDRRRQ